jgi:predicted nicotinamide N-methyase
MYGEEETASSTFGHWELEVTPTMEYRMLYPPHKNVVVDQNSKGYGELGSHIWDAGVALARYLEIDGVRAGVHQNFGENAEEEVVNNEPFVKGRRCIELGSGIGLTGTVAALLGANITLTDKPALLQLIRHNVEKNVEDTKNVHIEALCWGFENPFGEPFDIVLGADLTYDLEDIPLIVGQLKCLCNFKSTVLLAYGKQRYAMQFFFEEARKYFEIEHVPDEHVITNDIPHPISDVGIVRMRLHRIY